MKGELELFETLCQDGNMPVATSDLLSRVPSELSQGIASSAEQDADRVGSFLAELGLRGTAVAPLELPEHFLTGICVALRLRDWEEQGFDFHLREGLPSAAAVIRATFRTLVQPLQPNPQLLIELVRCWATHCSWCAPVDFGADLVVDDLDSDQAMEKLAEFLWKIRNHHADSTP